MWLASWRLPGSDHSPAIAGLDHTSTSCSSLVTSRSSGMGCYRPYSFHDGGGSTGWSDSSVTSSIGTWVVLRCSSSLLVADCGCCSLCGCFQRSVDFLFSRNTLINHTNGKRFLLIRWRFLIIQHCLYLSALNSEQYRFK